MQYSTFIEVEIKKARIRVSSFIQGSFEGDAGFVNAFCESCSGGKVENEIKVQLFVSNI